jgi:hypothetical protein
MLASQMAGEWPLPSNSKGIADARADKGPTDASSRPLGNTTVKPSVLERGIDENVAAKLRADHPEQNKREVTPIGAWIEELRTEPRLRDHAGFAGAWRLGDRKWCEQGSP